MSTATCPKCHRQVSLPITDDHTAWVRCPLCGGQYSLRMALDHVPPALEILGPEAGMQTIAPNEFAAYGDPMFGEMGVPGQMPAHGAPHEGMAGNFGSLEAPSHGSFPLHGEIPMHPGAFPHEVPASPSDTLSHPEHGGVLQPLPGDALPGEPLAGEHWSAGEPGANGEQTIDFHSAGTELGSPESAMGQPPALGQGEGGAISDHLQDFDLESPEHGELGAPVGFAPEGDLAEHELEDHAHGEHSEHLGEFDEAQTLEDDPSTAAFGELHGEHTIEPSGDAGEGAPEFRFADDAAGGNADEPGAADDEERHAMGGIATMVQTAAPTKKRRQAPLAVKLLGILMFFVFGLLGCYLVYGAFLFTGSDQFHLKQYFPKFLQNRVVEAPAKSRTKPGPESIRPVPPIAQSGVGPSTISPAVAPDSGTPPDNTTPPATGSPTATADSVAGPATPPGNTQANSGPPQGKPATTDLAQQPPNKSTSPLETTEDPTKSLPPDLEGTATSKPDLSKPDSPKFDITPVSPLGDTKPPTTTAPDKTAPTADKSTPDNPVATTEKPADKGPDKGPDKAPEKVAPEKISPEKIVDKPVIPADKTSPDVNPSSAVEPKSPIADRLADVDVALTQSAQAADNLKTAVAPGADRATVIRASVVNYKAISHLITQLGDLDPAGADADSAARINQLRKKAAALAEPMGSSAERDTTAMLAGKWIASPSRKENGAVIVGTLLKVEASDKGFVAHVKMPSDSKEMSFATTAKPDAVDGSPVVVLAVLNANDGGTAIEILSSGDEKATVAPPADKPVSDKPADKTSTDKPTDKSTDKPSDKPSSDKPAADKPAADKPAADPSTDKAAAGAADQDSKAAKAGSK